MGSVSLLIAVVAGFGALSSVSFAQAASKSEATVTRPASSGPAWASLSAQQRKVLGPLEHDWSTIDAQRKTKWLEVAARFPGMPAGEQLRVQERMTEWARLTPVERGRARMSFQESKQFSPEQKQARWEAYQALPDDERRALAARNKLQAERVRSPGSGTASVSAAQPKQTATARPAASAAVATQVAPTVMQAKPGATTTLMTTSTLPPAHHRPGQPKIAAKPGQVDRSTLLPRSEPQAAASAPRQP